MTDPVIITLAINGETSKKRNPHVPHKPEEIVADAVACFGAGVAVLHNHMGDINLTGPAAAERYALAWAPIRDAVPDAITVHIINRPGKPFLGSGETGQGPAAASVANAVANAAGKRLRDLPLTRLKIKDAIDA